MDKLLILMIAIAAIAAVAWWFFGKRTSSVVEARREGDKQIVEITVDGGYSPEVVVLQKDVSTELIFIRKDPSGCFEEVVLPDFGVSTHLPVNTPYTISVRPHETGEFTYTCGMNMFFGKIIVK